jgi:hypothetical protein
MAILGVTNVVYAFGENICAHANNKYTAQKLKSQQF